MATDREVIVVALSIYAYSLAFAILASIWVAEGPWTMWLRFALTVIAMVAVAHWLAHRAIKHIEAPNAH